MKKIDRITGLILIIIAGFAYYRSFSFPKIGVAETGPAFFPELLAFLIIGLSILLILKSFFVQEEEMLDFKGLKQVLITIGIMVFYLFGFFYIGFFVASLISLTSIMYVMGIRKKVTIILVSVLSTSVVYLIFYYVFNVPLPDGILI